MDMSACLFESCLRVTENITIDGSKAAGGCGTDNCLLFFVRSLVYTSL
jgi:hypothetical protein